jgi:hypothetical protein
MERTIAEAPVGLMSVMRRAARHGAGGALSLRGWVLFRPNQAMILKRSTRALPMNGCKERATPAGISAYRHSR